MADIMADIQDFNFNSYSLCFDLPGDDNLSAMIRDAEKSPHFVRCRTIEMGPISKVDGVWFQFTVQFDCEAAATWYALKWR